MKPLLAIFLTVLVDVLALTIILPLLPFMAQRYGASPFVADTLFATFALCQFISGPILGRISDRVGRKPTLLVSQMGTFLGLVLIGTTQRLELLFIGRMIDGLTAGNLTIAQAYITDVTKPENRTRAFGLIGIAFGVGFLIGPAASGVLAKHYGFHAPFLLAAGLSALSVVLTATLLPSIAPKGAGNTETRWSATRRYLGDRNTRGRIIELFVFTFSFSILTSGLALFVERRMGYDEAQTGYLFAFSALVGGSLQGGLGRLAKRFGEARLALAGFAFMAAGYLLIAPQRGLGLLLAGLGVGSVGSSVARPALTTLLTATVGEHEQGAALGVNQSGASLAQTMGPLLGGLLIDRGMLSSWALAAGAIAGTGFLVRWWLPVRRATTPAPEGARPAAM